ncbi:hypothetical protein [Halobaculum sp. MBLA0143]|uniref:hypothetical protein n=1 Tax=Halobaculum sp. MBLA0143 TaxID=3079933 RepID=UPI00352595F6
MDDSVPTTDRSTPLGVTVLALLGIGAGVLQLLGGLGSFGFGPVGLLGGTLGVAFALGQIATLVALLRLRRWALVVTLVVVGLSAVASLLSVQLLALLFDGIVAAYLLSVADRFD